jgi:ribosomal protein S18 acetylase RimI-like enzyme
MTGETRMRKAIEADIPAVLALYAQPGASAGSVMPLADAQTAFRRMSAHPGYALYVAEHGGALVGTFVLHIIENLAHQGAPTAVVENVVVDERCRGQGIGTAMMRFAMGEARRHRCYKLTLSSNLTRERAHAFYDALGFERHGYSFVVKLDDGH